MQYNIQDLSQAIHDLVRSEYDPSTTNLAIVDRDKLNKLTLVYDALFDNNRENVLKDESGS